MISLPQIDFKKYTKNWKFQKISKIFLSFFSDQKKKNFFLFILVQKWFLANQEISKIFEIFGPTFGPFFRNLHILSHFFRQFCRKYLPGSPKTDFGGYSDFIFRNIGPRVGTPFFLLFWNSLFSNANKSPGLAPNPIDLIYARKALTFVFPNISKFLPKSHSFSRYRDFKMSTFCTFLPISREIMRIFQKFLFSRVRINNAQLQFFFVTYLSGIFWNPPCRSPENREKLIFGSPFGHS